jgi:hypothetical protein
VGRALHCRVLGCVGLLVAWGWGADRTNPVVVRGRQIYLKGESLSGTPIVAELAGGPAPGSIVPCGSCHGKDGTGSAEGGVTATSIRWNDLIRPYEVSSPSRRRHGAYTEELFRRALADGIDPAGNRLDPAMPRFRMSAADASDLIEWLKQIGEATDGGVTSDSIVIGTLLSSDEVGSSSAAMREVLTAYFAQINQSGGIYGRRIDFRATSLGDGHASRIRMAQEFVDREGPFALVATVVSGFEREIGDLLKRKEIPLMGAYTPRPVIEDPPNPEVFYLDGGLRGQAEALARFATEQFGQGTRQVRIIASADEIYRDAAAAASSVFEQHGWKQTNEAFADPLLILSPLSSLGDLLNAAQAQILLPSLLANADVLSSRAGREKRLYLAYATLPSDYEAEAVKEYEELAQSAGLPKNFLASQLLALASARLLVEGLERCGRDVSRARLLDVFDNLWEFHTGFTAPVSFGMNRRVGFSGSHIATAGQETGGIQLVKTEP